MGLMGFIDDNIFSHIVFELGWIHLHEQLGHLFRCLSEKDGFDCPLPQSRVLAVQRIGSELIFDISFIATIIRQASPCLLQRILWLLFILNNKQVSQISDYDSTYYSKFHLGQHNHTVAHLQYNILATASNLKPNLYLSFALRTQPFGLCEAIPQQKCNY